MCSTMSSTTQDLFGADMIQSVREMGAAHQIGKATSYAPRGRCYNSISGYSRGRGRSHYQGQYQGPPQNYRGSWRPFLGPGRTQEVPRQEREGEAVIPHTVASSDVVSQDGQVGEYHTHDFTVSASPNIDRGIDTENDYRVYKAGNLTRHVHE